ncbi:MAG: MFS transporter [Myxococcota bacterium]|nr:MFS transporter [Myxococcota bacterium]
MSEGTPQATPQRTPLSTRFFYGVGSVAEGTKNTAFNVFLLFYYNNVLGLSGTASGLAIFVALCVDAVTDPLVGALSDDTRTRLGRRHPYMYASALPMALCFVALFHPPEGLGEQGLFLWLATFAVGVRVAMTLFMIPSSAMVAELTEDYDERTTLVSWRFLFGWIGGLSFSFIGYQVFLAPSEGFADGRLDPSGYGDLAITGACFIFGAILLCAGGTHRLIPRLKPPPPAQPFTLTRFGEELRPVLQNRSYANLVFAAIIASVAGGFSDVVGLYVNTYFWGFTTSQIATLLYGVVVGILVAFALTRPITERFEKKRACIGMATFAILFGPLPIFLRLLGVMPENGDPLLLWLILGHSCILVATVVAIGITFSSMVADVVDENELETGRRQEGIFTSAIAFASKATSGLGSLVAGIGLDVIAFPRGAEIGEVAPEKIRALGLVVGPGLTGLYLLTLIFVSRYRITRAGHEKTLEALAERRAAASPPEPA